MKILSMALRGYFILAGGLGLMGWLRGFYEYESIAWSFLVYASALITLFVSVSYLYFGWKLLDLLPHKKYWIQTVVFLMLCNTLASVVNGWLGQNQVKVYRELDTNGVIITMVVTILFYSALIYAISYLTKRIVANSSLNPTTVTAL